jgi:phosphatidylglycerol:prolipoprotein diacylglycerol transferase
MAGIPLFGLGLLLALWAVSSVAIVAWLAWRQGFNADTWGYVPILLLIGAIIRWLLPAICDGEGLPIHGYGVMMFLAVVAATALAVWRGRRLGVDPELIFALAFWLLLPGIIGARAFYVIEYWHNDFWPVYLNDGFAALVREVVSVNKGGLVVYGAFFGGVAGLLAFSHKHRLPLLAWCDLIAPSMVLGLAIGRIGCLLNGCCYGAVCDSHWALTFPPKSPPYQSQVARGQMDGFRLDADPNVPPEVRAVDPGSPADRAGLKRGDRIQRVNGFEVSVTGHAYWALEKALDNREPLKIELARGTTIDLPSVPIPARSRPVYPTQIYSTIDGLLLCLLLLAYTPLRRRDGEVFALLISIYPITRFLVESLRSDEAAVFGTGMSISQNVSILLLCGAAALWFYILRQPKGTMFPSPSGRG